MDTPCHTPLTLEYYNYAMWVGHPKSGLMVVFGVVRLQGGQPAAVYNPLGYPMPYGPDFHAQVDTK
jgi:hypothetical protein